MDKFMSTEPMCALYRVIRGRLHIDELKVGYRSIPFTVRLSRHSSGTWVHLTGYKLKSGVADIAVKPGITHAVARIVLSPPLLSQ